MKKTLMCPCCSQKEYPQCCLPYHQGQLPETALLLMKSRYSAYALQLPDYIIRTTHEANPAYTLQKAQWRLDIMEFSKQTQFEGLEIVEFVDGLEMAYVTFVAHLQQQGEDRTFCEKSLFVKVAGQWLYKTGEIGRDRSNK